MDFSPWYRPGDAHRAMKDRQARQAKMTAEEVATDNRLSLFFSVVAMIIVLAVGIVAIAAG